MRRLIVGMVALAGFVAPALAYENFIPLGTGYSSEVDSLPDFESEQSRINAQADLYETELYWQGRRDIEADSAFRRFQSDSELVGGDVSIDY
jgi:hypothetical protein